MPSQADETALPFTSNGVDVKLNEQSMTYIADPHFAEIMLGTLIGAEPPTPRLKRELRGKRDGSIVRRGVNGLAARLHHKGYNQRTWKETGESRPLRSDPPPCSCGVNVDRRVSCRLLVARHARLLLHRLSVIACRAADPRTRDVISESAARLALPRWQPSVRAANQFPPIVRAHGRQKASG